MKFKSKLKFKPYEIVTGLAIGVVIFSLFKMKQGIITPVELLVQLIFLVGILLYASRQAGK